ncbi:MAG: ChbG/HpnK family deacetylase [Myxococcaceae bacterium]|nr:ChbG/HpnK family deacetylase [Myxococcaceae bacterium]
MSTRLVVNADDLGLHPRIDEGILRAHAEGIVTSASALATGKNLSEALARARAQKLGVGAHLTVCSSLEPAARPSEVRWLAPGGRLRKNWREFAQAWLGQLIPAEEVLLELRAQVARIESHGVKVDHLDTHQHVHLLPGMARLVEQLAAELQVPLRWPLELPRLRWARAVPAAAKSVVLSALSTLRPGREAKRVRAVGAAQSGRLTERRLLRIIDALPSGDVELMCHPGLAPGVIAEDPSWRYGWEEELAALTSPRVRDRLASKNVTLATYAELSRA